jgi:hypothetical protein
MYALLAFSVPVNKCPWYMLALKAEEVIVTAKQGYPYGHNTSYRDNRGIVVFWTLLGMGFYV